MMDYSKHSTALLKQILSPGGLHFDEEHFRIAIKKELKRREKEAKEKK